MRRISMRLRWTRGMSILAIVAIIVVCCIGPLIYYAIGDVSTIEMVNTILQSLHPGMSRAEVYQVLNRATGFYQIDPSSLSRNCDNQGPIGWTSEDVHLKSHWWFIRSELIRLCYDPAGTLTRSYFAGP